MNYNHISHVHCLDNKDNPCGIPIEKHKQCCLCDLAASSITTIKLEQQVTSLELSKKLKELGVKQESLFYWASYMRYEHTGKGFRRVDDVWQIDMFGSVNGGTNPTGKEVYSAFSVAELGEMLPESTKFYHSVDYKDKWVCWCQNLDVIREDTLVNCAAKMLIYLLENKLTTL